MGKSIFGRMFIIYLIVSVLSLSLLGVMVSEIFRANFLEQKRDLLLQSVSALTDIAEQKYEGRISDTSFLYQIANTARDLSADVWLTDIEGNIWVMSDSTGSGIMEDGEFTETIQTMYKNAIAGKTLQFVSETAAGTPFMLLAVPLAIDGEIVGGIFIEADLTSLYSSLSDIYRQIALCALISGALVFVLIYLFARYITRDISKLSYAARQISKGNYRARVKIQSKNELGELGATFNRMARDIEQLDGLRSSFVANVSHELRTPMTAVQGFVQGMLDGAIPENERDIYLTKVLTETKRLNKLISDLLELSKVESGKFPLNIIPLNINELLCQCLITFEGAIEAKHIDVSVELTGDQLMVNADPDRIAQVMTNIIDNAVKFTPEKGTLRVGTRIAGQKVEVFIADSGKGIPEKDLPYIFERFYKADRSHNRERPGYGIGLSIVRSIIEQMGEKIWVESKKDVGTTFTFTLKKQ